MGALSQKDVGDYLGKYYVSGYQKISSFVINAKEKQGGNVASYFCTPEGHVLHLVPGPVAGAKLLDEARWVVETVKMADLLEIKDFKNLQLLFRKAHLDRLAKEQGIKLNPLYLPVPEPHTAATVIHDPSAKGNWTALGNEARVHYLLAVYPLPKIGRVYNTVFQSILNQPVSTVPVVQKN